VSRRNRELLLLLLVGVMSTTIYVSVYAARFHEIGRASLVYGGVYLGVFAALHVVVRWRLPEADPYLLPITALLTAVGLTEIYRIEPHLARLQGQWLFVGAALFAATIFVVRDPRRLDDYRYVIGGVGLLLLLVTIVLGTNVNGARLWIRVAGFSIQPSELAKLAIVIFLAGYLNDVKEMLSVPTARIAGLRIPALKYFGPLVVMWVLSLALLIFMKDFGMSLLFLATFVAMLYMATARVVYVITGAALFALGAGAAYQYVAHVHERFAIWIDPWSTATTSGYQLLQSLFAIADGGILGPGVGRGYLLFADRTPVVPDLPTDFIFAAVANELGLAGAIGLILLYLLFCWRGFHIAVWATDGFSKLLAAGLATVFGLQTVIILGGVTRLIPLTGVTLPFVSYGGSSITANLVLVALLLLVSHRTNARRDAGGDTQHLVAREMEVGTA
jgi:cell division protein FtsW (lipid II flippase)